MIDAVAAGTSEESKTVVVSRARGPRKLRLGRLSSRSQLISIVDIIDNIIDYLSWCWRHSGMCLTF